MVAARGDGAGILAPAIGVNPAKGRVVRAGAEILQRDLIGLAAIEEIDPAYGSSSSQRESPAPG